MDMDSISFFLLKIFCLLCFIILTMVLLEFINFENIKAWTRKSLTTKNDLESNKTNDNSHINELDFYCNKFHNNGLPFRQHGEGYHYIRDRLKYLERSMEEWRIEDTSEREENAID